MDWIYLILFFILWLSLIIDYFLDYVYFINFKDILEKLGFDDIDERLYSNRYYIRRWLEEKKCK